MKNLFQKSRVAGPLVLALAVGFSLPPRIFAIFGIGDIVFDPTSYASILSTATSQASTLTKIIEEVKIATSIYNNGLQVYGLAQQEATFLKHKELLQAVGAVAQHVHVVNHSGETAGWDKALTLAGGLANAGVAWQRASMPGTSMQARIQLADSFGTDALNIIGTCNDSATQNDGALAKLEALSMSASAASNTAAAQGNLNNMASTQMMRMQQCQHAIANEQLKQNLLKSLRERDSESHTITTYASVDTIMAAHPMYLNGMGAALGRDID